MHVGACEYGRDRNLSVGNIEVAFVAAPILLLPFAGLLDPDGALLGKAR